jgi:hypothetical protein
MNKLSVFVLVVIPILVFFYVGYTILFPSHYNLFFFSPILPLYSFTTSSKNMTAPIAEMNSDKPSLLVYYPYFLVSLTVFYRAGMFIVQYDVLAVLLFLIICLVYGFYPLRYRVDDYFKRKGFGPAIAEYRLVTKILYIEIPLLVFFASIFYTASLLFPAPFGTNPFLEYLERVSFPAQVALQYSVTAGALWMLSHTMRKEFRYYLARAYVKTIPDNKDDVEKMNWLIMALNVYNKYLARILSLQFETAKLYSALIIESKVHISDRIKLISESFDDNDKLKPARRLSEIIKVQKIEDFLAKPSLSGRLITWGTFAGVTLPVVISILQWLFQSPKH